MIQHPHLEYVLDPLFLNLFFDIPPDPFSKLFDGSLFPNFGPIRFCVCSKVFKVCVAFKRGKDSGEENTVDQGLGKRLRRCGG